MIRAWVLLSGVRGNLSVRDRERHRQPARWIDLAEEDARDRRTWLPDWTNAGFHAYGRRAVDLAGKESTKHRGDGVDPGHEGRTCGVRQVWYAS
jgi:hypothetical protein